MPRPKAAIKVHDEPYWEIQLRMTVHPGSTYHSMSKVEKAECRKWLAKMGSDSKQIEANLERTTGTGGGYNDSLKSGGVMGAVGMKVA